VHALQTKHAEPNQVLQNVLHIALPSKVNAIGWGGGLVAGGYRVWGKCVYSYAIWLYGAGDAGKEGWGH